MARPAHDGSAAFDVTVTFSEDVAGFAAVTDLAITGGALTNGADSITRTDARTYTASITPSGRRRVTVQAPAGAARDAAGNDSSASNTVTVYLPPGITVSTTMLSVREGGSATYTVVLDSPPTGDVSVIALLDNGDDKDICECDVDISLMDGSAEDDRHPMRGILLLLTFTPTDWDTPQTVTVLAALDVDAEDGTDDIEHSANSDDDRYDDLEGPTVTVTERDKDAFDNTAPTVASIARRTPSDAATHADSLTFRVTFSEDVANVDTEDFSVTEPGGGTATTATVQSAEAAPGGTSAWDITVSGGNLADYDGSVGLAIAAGHNIADLSGNALAVTTPSGADESYTVDNTAPTVASIARQTPSDEVTSADSLTFRVTFSEDVEYVGPADFSVTGAAGGTATTATVQSATAVPGGTSVYDVTVRGGNLGAYNGTVGLAFHSDQDIADPAGNALADTTPSGTDETYTADEAPTVASIARRTPSEATTKADSLTFRVTFSEDVRNVHPADFSVTGAAGDTATTATVQSATAVPGGTSAWDVVVRGGDLADYDGTVGLGFATDQDIADAAGSALADTTPSGADEAWTLDNTAPTPTLRASPINHDGSSTSTVTIDFGEAVNGFTAGDVTVDGGARSSFSGSDGDARYTLTVTPGGNADITVSVAADVATDLVGNASLAADDLVVGYGICGRTQQVRDGILARIRGVSDCGSVTPAHLRGIGGILNLSNKGITSLQAGDFAGLSSLPSLWLWGNTGLTSLPAGVFSGLTSLGTLLMEETGLTSLPAGVFSGLTRLRQLQLNDTGLTSLPAGVFEGLTRLFSLSLSSTPGAPFTLTMEPELSEDGRTLVVRVAEGAPFAMTTSLTVTGGTATVNSATVNSVTVPVGATESAAITITPSQPGGAVTVTLGNAPAVVFGFTGLRTAVGGPVPPFDTTLSALSLTDAADAAVALTPLFAADTTTYAASVANGVSTITVAATANAVHGTVAITPADADSSTAGHQVALDVGANTITATVTDRFATGDYTINVTRLAPAGAGCDTGEDIWCAQLTVGTDTSAGTDGYSGGSLNDDDFRASGLRRVLALDWTHSGGDLTFELDSVPAAAVYRQWTLEIGDARVSFAGATASGSNEFSFPGFYAAASGRTPPAPGSTVFVRLTRSLGAGCETNDIWCTRLTVGTFGGLDGFSGGSLDDEDFVAAGRNRRVSFLDWEHGSGSLLFTLDAVPAEAVYRQWTLHIGDDRVSFAGVTASQNRFIFANYYATSSGRTPPASGTTVTVRLTRPGVATLGALGLTDASGTAVTLDPVFAADTATYTAAVGSDVATVTVAATPNDSGAAVAIVPADSDTSTEGHQVDLDVGANPITATVTNGSTTGEAYTITVTRAPPPVALVSNLGQSSTATAGFFTGAGHAQAFTAGDNPAGYTLSAVEVQIGHAFGQTGDVSQMLVSVWSATAGGLPNESLGALMNPGSVPDDGSTSRFTTSGIDLEMGKTYIVVFEAASFTALAVPVSDSPAEDMGGASGWGIDDGGLHRPAGSSTWATRTAIMLISIIGTTNAGTSGTEAPADGLQARFGALPVWHTGMPFWTELHFSAEPDIGYKDLRDKALEATGARITRAQRIDKGSKRSWRLLVEPAGFGDVSLTLPATEDCTAEGAVCTAEGERLETGLALAVPGPGDRLAARLKGTSSHTGEAFRLKLHFNHEPELRPEDVQGTLFAVTGGRIAQAERLEKGSNLGWRLTVEPEGLGDVGLELPATEDCAAEGAVCTSDGRRLERGIAWTVEGPAAFSVSDAEVEEEPGAVLAFEVSLSRQLRAEARVDVATVDGTATAGSDYEAVTQTLVFAPGETLKTVEVVVLDDAHDEGEETMTLVLSNAEGALIDDGEGTGTIVNNDAIPKAWIARFGRTVTGQVLDAVEARLAAPRQAGGRMTLAGYPLVVPGGSGSSARTGGGAETAAELSAEDRAALAALGGRIDGARTGRSQALREPRDGGPEPKSLDITRHALVTGTAFTLSAGSAEGGGFGSLWGHASVAGFDGREDALTLDGEVTTGLLGADWAAERWTAGLALGHSAGTGGYRDGECAASAPADGTPANDGQPVGCGGRIEATLTGLYPYAGLDVTERLSVWLAGGHGAGGLTVIPDGSGAIDTDLSMHMGAAGTRIAVREPEGGAGLSLALKGDGRFTRTTSDAARAPDGGNLAEAEADVWLLRVGVEGSRRFALGGSGTGDDTGASLTPSFEVGVRRDGGDAETGFGADMGGGLALAAPERGLRLDLKGRALVAHEASGFREWGASAGFGFDPRPSTERGLSLSLTQALGASPSGGMDALLDRETLAGFAGSDAGSGFEASSRLSGQLGYGLPAFGGGFTGTPNVGIGLSSDGARDWRLGWRLTPARPLGLDFSVTLDATRRESANADAEHGVALRGTLRW